MKSKISNKKSACAFSLDKFIGMFKVVNNKDIFAKSEFTMQEIK